MDTHELLNSFVVEHKKLISEYDINQFKHAARFLTESSMNVTIHNEIFNKCNIYLQYLQKTIDNISSISLNADDLDIFFSNVYESLPLSNKKITIPIHNEEDIEKIRPEYISTMIADFNVTIREILRKDLNIEKVKTKYLLNDYEGRMKRQIVKTSLVINDVRDMMSMDSPSMVVVDSMFIQHNIIPFIRTYQSNAENIKAIAYNLKGQINNAIREYKIMQNSVESMRSSGQADANTMRVLDYAMSNMFRILLNVIAYSTTMTIRKMTYYTFNMTSFTELYNTIHDYFPEMDAILHESTSSVNDIDDTTLFNSIINNNCSIVRPHIQSVIGRKKMEISNYVANKFNYKLDYTRDIDTDKYPYDSSVYKKLNNTIMQISNQLHEFELAIKDEDCIADEVMNKCGLDQTFISRYTDILSSVDNIEYYVKSNLSNDGSNMFALFNDISKFEQNLEIIVGNICKVYKYMEMLLEKFDINSNNMEIIKFNEIKSILDTVMINYKDYILNVVKRLLDRLDNLTDTLENNANDAPQSSEPAFVPYNYSLESYLAEINDIELNNKQIFESMIKEYKAIRAKKDRGVNIVYEKEEETPSSGTETVSADEAKSGTVETDAQQQHKEEEKKSDNNDTKSDSSTSSSTTDKPKEKKDKGGIIKAFKDLINKIIEAFMGKSNKMTNRNNVWIAKNKEAILGLDYSNSNITVAPYPNTNTDTLLSHINAAITKISSINPNSIPNELKGKTEDAHYYLFSNIPKKIGKLDKFTDKVKTFYQFGGSGKTNLIRYHGKDAKNIVETMINYCENYETDSDTISKKLDELANTAIKTQEKLIVNMDAPTSTNESVIFEADEPAKTDNDDSPSIHISDAIVGITRGYILSVLTIVEKKYSDYMRVLSALAPKSEDNKPDDGKKSSDDNADNKTDDNSEENE